MAEHTEEVKAADSMMDKTADKIHGHDSPVSPALESLHEKAVRGGHAESLKAKAYMLFGRDKTRAPRLRRWKSLANQTKAQYFLVLSIEEGGRRFVSFASIPNSHTWSGRRVADVDRVIEKVASNSAVVLLDVEFVGCFN